MDWKCFFATAGDLENATNTPPFHNNAEKHVELLVIYKPTVS